MVIPKKIVIKWIIVFLAIILPVAMLSVYSFLEIRKNMTNNIYKEKKSIAKLSASILKERFDRIHDIGTSIATNIKFSEAVCEGKWDKTTQVLKNIPKTFPFIDRIFVTDTSGILNVDIPQAIPGVRGTDFSYRDWFKGVSKHWTPYVSEVYRRKALPSFNVVAFATPIKSSHPPHSVCGIFVLQISLDTLLKWSREIEVGEAGFISIIDHIGHVAASLQYKPQQEIVNYSEETVVQKILNGKSGIDITYDHKKKENCIIAYEQVQKYEWGIIVQQPLGQAFKGMYDNLRFIVTVYALVFLLTILFAYSILKNILKRIRAEEIAKQKSWELEQSNNELEQFVYMASHDLQEPLRTISNFTGLIEEKYSGKNADDTRYLRFIINATSKMQNLIKDLLDLSRVGRNKEFAVIDCNKVLNDVISDIETLIKESNAKITSVTLPLVKGNETELKQLFQNLISNAIKFHKKNVSPEIEITVEEKDTEYLFAFRDNGIGIEMQYKDRIFVMFQRLHKVTEYPGTGIGLATCKKIVSLHNGKLWVGSKLDEGSTFYFTIPSIDKSS